MKNITLKSIQFEELKPDRYYFVKLKPGVISDQRYDIDFCRVEGKSDGGGIGWIKWYPHNISSCWELPEED